MQLLGALIPGIALEADPPAEVPYSTALRMQVKGSALGLRTDRLPEASRAVLAALSAANAEGERLLIQLVLAGGTFARLTGPHPGDPSQGVLSQLAFGQRPASAEITRRLRDKAGEHSLSLQVRMASHANTEVRSRQLLRSLIASLRTNQSAGTELRFAAMRPATLMDYPLRSHLRLTAPEVLALAGWPLESETLPGLPSAHPKQLRPGPGTADTTRQFGLSTAPGKTVALGIAASDALFHSVLTGPTGVGKSSLLLNLITADMKAGRSIVVIDPKADLVMDTLARVPESRTDDVVVLDPGHELPVGINPLLQPGRSPELVADGILTVIRDLFPNLFGPRTSDVLHVSLLTLAVSPGATLSWLPKLLTEQGFRRDLMPHIHDDAVRSFWAQFDQMSAGQQAQYIGPVLSRLRQFLLRPALRRVLDQPQPRFTLDEIFAKQRILLVPLNAGLLGGETSRLLGSLLVSQLWGLSLARTSVPPAGRRPVSIYIDEAQEFLRLGGELTDALARSRSLGVAWHLAHQYREQFSPEVRAAVDANARNKIAFTLGIKDARDLAAMSTDLQPEDFMSLPRYGVYAQLMHDGRLQNWASGKTLPPPPTTSNPGVLIARSQHRYGARVVQSEVSSEEITVVDPSAGHQAELPPTLGRKPRRHD
jgi:hypothetical protein